MSIEKPHNSRPVAAPSSGAIRPLRIASFAELLKHEREIVQRIDEMPNGGHLFLTHPFLLFADIGVELSDEARQEILKREPRLAGLSPAPYRALRHTKAKQRVRFHIRGLFNPNPEGR